MRKTYIFLWVLLIAYAGFVIYQNPQILDDPLIQELMTLKFTNSLVEGIFMMMGVLPLLFLIYALRDHYKLGSLILVFLSFVVGAFAVLPYLVFVDPHPQRPFRAPWFRRWARSPITYTILASFIALRIVMSLILGNFVTYIALIQTSPFIAIMTADFLVLTLIPYVIINGDSNKIDAPLVYGIPWFGFLYYLFQLYRPVPKEESPA